MRVIFLFVLLLCSSHAYTVYNNGVKVYDGDTKIRSEWWGANFGLIPNVWNRNYTAMAIPQALQCEGTLPSMTGKLVFASILAQPCDFETVYQRYAAAGAAVISGFTIWGEYSVLWRQGRIQDYRRPTIPWIFSDVAGWNCYSNPYNPSAVAPNGVLAMPGLGSFVLTSQKKNITINIDLPTENSLWTDWLTVGSTTQLSFVACLIASLTLLSVSSAKLYAFVTFQGVKVQIPHIITFVGILASVIGIFQSMCGYNSWRAPAMSNLEAADFFYFFMIGFGLTVCTIMGLYFKEVSCLSTNQEIVGLGSVSIIAIVAIGLLWAFIIAIPAVYAADPPSFITGGLATEEVKKYFNIILSFIVVGCAATLFLYCWGAFFLVMNMPQPRNIKVLVVVATTGLATFLQVITAIVGMLSIVQQNLSAFVYISTVEYLVMQDMLFVFVPCIVIHLVLYNFKVSFSKEIELSKSATSSTSSSSSSSSSSRSTSSSKSTADNDPVIEL